MSLQEDIEFLIDRYGVITIAGESGADYRAYCWSGKRRMITEAGINPTHAVGMLRNLVDAATVRKAELEKQEIK